MKNKLLLIISLNLLAVTAFAQVYKDSSQSVERRVEDLLSRMSLEEKILQLSQYTFGLNPNPNNIGQEVKDLPSGIGSLIFFSQSPELRNQVQRKAVEDSRLGIPILFGFDIIHGMRTVAPIPLAQACSFNPQLVQSACEISAREAKLSGVDWTFSPMIDVARDPRWGRVSEGYGEDPYMNSVFGVAAVKGYQGKDLSGKYSIASCLKHFAGYGESEGGRDYRYTDISMQSLWETYLPPYESCVKAGAVTVMSAFNDINGCPATANSYLMTDVLKQKWGFDGFIVSDWNAVEQLVYQGVAKDRKDCALKAFSAGLDMDMKDGVYLENMEQLLKEGKISMSQIDDSVRRILTVKFRLGLFENPYTVLTSEDERYLNQSDIDRIEELACESMVLLKNDDGVLPLPDGSKSIALIGPLAKDQSNMLGSWSFHGQPADVVSIYDGLSKVVGSDVKINYSKGCELDGDDKSLFAQAVKAARKSDIVLLCLGEDKIWSGENASRSTIALPKIQEELLSVVKKVGKPVVVLLSSGRPLELARIEPLADAILQIWQPGVTAGKAVAGILTGKVNPSGKLAVTFPLTTGQIPTYYNMRSAARPFDKMGDYQDIPTHPLYWFGHGLSYTEFEYSDASLNVSKASAEQKVIAEVTVRNVGKYPGKETVLWYVNDPISSVSRPVKELKFFEKQELTCGQSRTFRFEIDPMRDLSYINSKGERVLEPGKFHIIVGDYKLTLEIE